MKKYLLLLPFLLLGLYLTFYPQINTVVYDCQAEQAISAWKTQVEQAKEGNRPHPGNLPGGLVRSTCLRYGLPFVPGWLGNGLF